MIQEQWPTVLALLGGLIGFKFVITTALGPAFGLTKAESVRTGLLLSGGGEFAFVVLTLGDKLKVVRLIFLSICAIWSTVCYLIPSAAGPTGEDSGRRCGAFNGADSLFG